MLREEGRGKGSGIILGCHRSASSLKNSESPEVVRKDSKGPTHHVKYKLKIVKYCKNV